MRLIHAIPFEGHVRKEKTLAWILACFFGLASTKISGFLCLMPKVSAHSLLDNRASSLTPLPAIRHVLPVDWNGYSWTLEKSTAGYRFILVTAEYATRYPEMLPLCSMNARVVVAELMKIFA